MGLLAKESTRQIIVVAPTAFKGTLSPHQAARAITSGVRRVLPHAEILSLPVADGGDGTREVLAKDESFHTVTVHDPLGRKIEAGYSRIGQTAIIEMAEASGLALLRKRERDPERTSTFGTGELIRAAWKAGAREILLGAGGSATVDGGKGAIEAIGKEKKIFSAITVLCDVKTAYRESANVFGPQKGASPEAIKRLEERLHIWNRQLPRDIRTVRGGGAAGGLAGGLAAYGARLVSGSSFVLQRLQFSKRIRGATLLLTGEGRYDPTSLQGKVVGEVLTKAGQIPHRILCGMSLVKKKEIVEMASLAGTQERSMRAPVRWLRHAAEVAVAGSR